MQQTLTTDDIALLAPAVFNHEKHSRTSSRYTHIPTDQIIADLQDENWFPVQAETVNPRKQSPDHAKHMLRFRSKDNLTIKHDQTGDMVVPELVITNSHDGKNAFRAHVRIFRLVCSNGLVVSDGVSGGYKSMRVTHKGYDEKTVLQMIKHTIDGFSQVLKSINDYRETILEEDEQIEMAHQAIELRWPYKYIRPHGITPEQFLIPKRPEDSEKSLWNTYNVIQENMFRGGVSAFNEKGRRVVTRPIKNVRENLRFNKSIWQLLDETYQKVK